MPVSEVFFRQLDISAVAGHLLSSWTPLNGRIEMGGADHQRPPLRQYTPRQQRRGKRGTGAAASQILLPVLTGSLTLTVRPHSTSGQLVKQHRDYGPPPRAAG